MLLELEIYLGGRVGISLVSAGDAHMVQCLYNALELAMEGLKEIARSENPSTYAKDVADGRLLDAKLALTEPRPQTPPTHVLLDNINKIG